MTSLKSILERAYSRETSYPGTRDQWTKDVPCFGHCAIVALVVHRLYGGKIVKNNQYHHYFNITEEGMVLDLTRDQFPGVEYMTIDSEVSREQLLSNHDTKERYEVFVWRCLRVEEVSIFLKTVLCR
jgi:hypothetical protein